ncbi:hypothetical protein STCU_08001 [Strigomonas culicis]|uniref:Uncharacterized protein n=1 Tax=Strigomonas culicis TaxID=28005 RepID=S9U1Z7_9TRYP|nr:hypothetical protein STCU_08001 [Strigomonas culicis]|eukprot:EPY22958.1 hypothetical protein STCU_08001 [Strigomonas culicis]
MDELQAEFFNENNNVTAPLTDDAGGGYRSSGGPAHVARPDVCGFYYNQSYSNVNYYTPHERLVPTTAAAEGAEDLNTRHRVFQSDTDEDNADGGAGGVATEEDVHQNSFTVTARGLAPGWRRGPSDPEGGMYDASDANLLCMDVLNTNNATASFSQASAYRAAARGAGGPLCVVGGADHGLKVFDLYRLQTVKTLYNKQYGHTEWVTAVKFLGDGRIVSGGMDSKICLWESAIAAGGRGRAAAGPSLSYVSGNAPARCTVLEGHTASISQLEVSATNSCLLSASYDRSLRLYHLPAAGVAGRGRESAVLAGAHNAAITHFSWNYNFVLSGDKKGALKVWDLLSEKPVRTLATRKGAVTALRGLAVPPAAGAGAADHCHSCFLGGYGDMTGALTVVDLRAGAGHVFQDTVHPGGALTDLHFLYASPAPQDMTSIPLVATCGADQKICILEPRRNFVPLFTFEEPRDFIYCMSPLSVFNAAHSRFEHLLFAGTGDGSLYVYDAVKGTCCYGLGANTAAVRCIAALPGLLATAGDDGKAMVYHY